jgi:hypothetical protein
VPGTEVWNEVSHHDLASSPLYIASSPLRSNGHIAVVPGTEGAVVGGGGGDAPERAAFPFSIALGPLEVFRVASFDDMSCPSHGMASHVLDRTQPARGSAWCHFYVISCRSHGMAWYVLDCARPE